MKKTNKIYTPVVNAPVCVHGYHKDSCSKCTPVEYPFKILKYIVTDVDDCLNIIKDDVHKLQ